MENSVRVEMLGIRDLVLQLPDITYLSLGIEGGELEILQAYPWEKSKPKVVTVEHNNLGDQKVRIREVMQLNGYKLELDSLTNFESWYVLIE